MSRMRLLSPLLFALCAVVAGCGERASERDLGVASASDLRSDERLAPLFAPCAHLDFYDRDTSDMVPILLGKLERGERQVLSRAMEDLSRLGEPAIEGLRRAVERHASQRDGLGPLQNALDAVALHPSPKAREVLWFAMAHPYEVVRSKAVRALARDRAAAEDFDRLEGRLWLERGTLQLDVLNALAVSDPGRFAERALDWVEAALPIATEPLVARLLARHARGESAVRAAQLAESAALSLRPWLLAPLATQTEGPARERLRGELAAPEGERRAAALAALDETGGYEMALGNLRADPDPAWRRLAASVVARHGGDDRRAVEGLALALDDSDSDLRRYAAAELVQRGHAEARERVLSGLMGPPADLGASILALRSTMRSDADLADAAQARLLGRLELERHLPFAQRAPTLQALGNVPLASAAERVLGEAIAEGEGTRIDGLSAHRWATIQAANSGPAGRSVLAQRLAKETDGLRVLDLLWAVAGERDEVAEQALLAHLNRADRPEEERLYAAALLARNGPADRIAPELKRAQLRFETDVRRALQCLLWTWY